MDKIKFQDINFSVLKRLQFQGTQATIYRDGDTCFKILDGLYEEEKEVLYRKFLDMDGIKIDNVLLPRQLIVENGKLKGYTMDYFENSMPLSDKFIRYVECKKLFNYVSKASQILRTIHQNGIIMQDLSFENILVDKDGNVAFCDIDGCNYNGYRSPFVSILTKNFFIDYRKEKIHLSDNLDRISMMLSFYCIVYGRELQKLSKRKYHKLSDKIYTLESLREYANVLVDKNNNISEIPYLDESIDLTDDYVIDRKEQLSLVRKIFIR